MTFQEWWADQEFNPMIYGVMEAAWDAGRAATKKEDAAICENLGKEIVCPEECAAAIRKGE